MKAADCVKQFAAKKREASLSAQTVSPLDYKIKSSCCGMRQLR